MISRRAALASIITSAAAIGQQRNDRLFGDALAYERFMGRWSNLLAAEFVRFVNPADGGRMLDVGSGTGALTFTLGRLRPRCHAVGIDPSKEYVAYAASKNPFHGRITFEAGDAQHLTFRNAAFDHSLSLLVFNFIPDRKRALAEVVRVTKPGGSVAAAVWDYGEGMRMLRAFWDAAAAVSPDAKKLDEATMPLCRRGELGALWKAGGLEPVSEAPLDIAMQFQSFSDYWDPFLLGQGPGGAFVKSLDSQRRQALRDALKQRLAVQSKDGSFTLPARAWAVRGVVPR